MRSVSLVCASAVICLLFFSCANKPPENKAKKLSIVTKLKEHAHLPVKERLALYYRLREEEPGTYDFGNENELTLYGYSYLWKDSLADAIAIFDLIVTEFPNSSNAYDSRGEAHLLAQDTNRALLDYERSLLLNPDNFHAEDIIEQIHHPERKPLTVREKYEKVYSREEYGADLDQLGHKLLSIHPHALKFITKEQYWKNVNYRKSLITATTTYAEFAWHCNAIIASIGCSHTASSTMQNAYHEYALLPLEKMFPLRVRLVAAKLYVVDPMNNADRVAVKDEILRINGIETTKLLSDVFEHLPSQANIQTNKRQQFNTYFAALLPYAFGLPTSFEIVVQGKAGAIKLHTAKKVATELYDPSIRSCAKDLCLEEIDRNSAVLTIASFNYYEWGEFPVFRAFVDSTMKVVRSKKYRNLIIDLRYNRGGSQYASIHLLQYLIDRPFTYYSTAQFAGKTDILHGEEVLKPNEYVYDGNLFFLIDGNGTSTTGHFMSLVNEHDLGTIIGEELGSNQFCTAGQTLFRLRNTKLEVSVANNTHVSAASKLSDRVGVLPDYPVEQSIEDYLARVDAVKNFALSLARR
ncbi:MAG: peptidase S41 [Ignavibacteria bacterium]|nr:peptidase S41 [Ignavibacteria bacterium]